MKTINVLLCILLFAASCKKNNIVEEPSVITPVVVPSLPDTLGVGWSKVGAIPAEENVTDIYFTDQNNGYITTSQGIYRSSNAGFDWVKIRDGVRFYNIGAIGSKATFVGGTSDIVYTLDNGLTTQSVNYTNATPGSGPGFQDCSYSSSDVCYAASKRYIWKSTNGGISFDTLYNFQDASSLAVALQFVNDLNGWITRDTSLLKTIDGGVTWNSVKTSNNNYCPISFPDQNVGFVANYSDVFKTSDGGSSWQTNPRFITELTGIEDIHFFDSLNGYCIAGTKLYKTTNGGNSWTKEVRLGGKYLNEIFFLDETHGWACGEYGYVLRFNL